MNLDVCVQHKDTIIYRGKLKFMKEQPVRENYLSMKVLSTKILVLAVICFGSHNNVILAQSPFRIFTLDCNLNSETERATASLVTRAFLIRQPDILRNSKKVKPFAPMDWDEFQHVIDSLHSKLPVNGDYSWEEDYGLKTEGAASEKWKELTFYECDLKNGSFGAEIIEAKRRYLLQIRINLDKNGQIDAIRYLKGKQMKNRDSNILYAYRILYKSSPKHKKSPK
jgi:hypothetical protein